MSPSPRHLSRRRSCALIAAGAAALLGAVGSGSAWGQMVDASWLNPVNGSWTDPTKWSSDPDYPNNDGTTTYNATIDAVGSPYTIDLLSTVNLGTLTMNS